MKIKMVMPLVKIVKEHILDASRIFITIIFDIIIGFLNGEVVDAVIGEKIDNVIMFFMIRVIVDRIVFLKIKSILYKE